MVKRNMKFMKWGLTRIEELYSERGQSMNFSIEPAG